MADSIYQAVEALDLEIKKSISIIENYNQKTVNFSIKNLLASIKDQDTDIENMLSEFINDTAPSVLGIELSPQADLTFQGDANPQQAENDKYFLLLFSEFKLRIISFCKKFINITSIDEIGYFISQIQEIQEKQYTLLKDRYDLEVL